MDDLLLISRAHAAFTKYLATAAHYFFWSSTIFVIVCFQRMEYVFLQVLKNEERRVRIQNLCISFQMVHEPSLLFLGCLAALLLHFQLDIQEMNTHTCNFFKNMESRKNRLCDHKHSLCSGTG